MTDHHKVDAPNQRKDTDQIMGKKLGTILVLIVAGALMLYSASRTMHLLTATLPAGQEILGAIALAAFDIGLVAWLIVFLRGAEGALQRGISLLMVIVDLCGVVIGFMGDTLLTSGQTGLLAAMAEGDKQTIIMLTAGVIAINIAGTIFYHMADPSNLRRMAEENARDKITTQSLKAIENEASTLAQELAPVIAADWVDQMRADFTAALKTVNRQSPAPAPNSSALDRIRRRLTAPQEQAPMQTMATEGEEVETPKGKKRS